MNGGKRTGSGRKKGAQSKVNAALREKPNAGGIAPLEFMLQVMRNEDQDLAVRLEMAKSAAPYLHPRLQAIEHSDKDQGTIPRCLRVRFLPPVVSAQRQITHETEADKPCVALAFSIIFKQTSGRELKSMVFLAFVRR